MRGLLISLVSCIILATAAFLLWRKRTRSIDEISAHADSYWDSIKEKREFIRFEKKLDVICRVPERSNTRYEVFSKDISGGGICLRVPEMLPAGSLLELEINIPQDKPLHIRGEVVWVKQIQAEASGMERLFNTGVKFYNIKDKDKAVLLKFLASSTDAR